MTVQADTAVPSLRLENRSPGGTPGLRTPPAQPTPAREQPDLLDLSDAQLGELFRSAPARWATELDRLEAHHARSAERPPSQVRRDVDRLRDALRAAMWTQHRWEAWKVE
ncbi:hypothetical protein [Kineococcus sp. SYSU DK003]|uniref:hypothetical protein n=1 Tax=Kineococcus sp. SYSU DK003 TaxID=3383124 RepID=UPI003D7C41D0